MGDETDRQDPIPESTKNYHRGFEAYVVSDYETALQHWLPLAREGNADAQYGLGVMYLGGLGVPRDFAEAADWVRMAAEQGNAAAQITFASMYDSGAGVEQRFEDRLRRTGLQRKLGDASHLLVAKETTYLGNAL